MSVSLETIKSLEQGIALGRIDPMGLRIDALASIARHLATLPEEENTLVHRSLLLGYVELVSDGNGKSDHEVIDRLGGLIRIKLKGL